MKLFLQIPHISTDYFINMFKQKLTIWLKNGEIINHKQGFFSKKGPLNSRHYESMRILFPTKTGKVKILYVVKL